MSVPWKEYSLEKVGLGILQQHAKIQYLILFLRGWSIAVLVILPGIFSTDYINFESLVILNTVKLFICCLVFTEFFGSYISHCNC